MCVREDAEPERLMHNVSKPRGLDSQGDRWLLVLNSKPSGLPGFMCSATYTAALCRNRLLCFSLPTPEPGHHSWPPTLIRTAESLPISYHRLKNHLYMKQLQRLSLHSSQDFLDKNIDLILKNENVKCKALTSEVSESKHSNRPVQHCLRTSEGLQNQTTDICIWNSRGQ